MNASSDLPLVSITMPAYNYATFVEEAVRSAWSQDYPNLELIAVDDGSTDQTLQILERLGPESPIPMRVVRGQHRGVCAALNLALEHATGKYVSMLHADDYYRRDKVSAQIAVMERDPEMVLVHSEYTCVDAAGKPNGYGSWLDTPPARGHALRGLLLLQSDVRSPTMLMRRSTLDAVGRYDESLPVEDHQSILRLAKQGKIGHVPEPLVFRRVHSTNVSFNTHKGRKLRFEEFSYNILREVIPPDMSFGEICALQAGVTIQNSIAQGGWRKGQHGLAACWREFPEGRPVLARAALMGARSYVWMKLMLPVLPAGVVAAVRGAKRRMIQRATA